MSTAAMLEMLVGTERKGQYVDLSNGLSLLRRAGWSDADLARNELGAALAPTGRPAHARSASYRDFWATIAELTREATRANVPPIFIKSIRHYKFSDSNVDLLVPRWRMRDVVNRLCRSHWRMPGRTDRIEQALIERRKLKLPSTTAGLLSAHLYGAISWRYQDDIGLLRTDGLTPNDAHLRRVLVSEYCSDLGGDETLWFYHPFGPAELVMQAAHVVFENYRITLGEAIHIVLLHRETSGVWKSVTDLAKTYGCGRAVELVIEKSQHIVNQVDRMSPADFPLPVTFWDLWPCYVDRVRHLRARRRWAAAGVEAGSFVALWLTLRSLRRVRRLRRGHEDFRPMRGM